MLQVRREFFGGEMMHALFAEIAASRRDSASPPDF